MLLAFDTASRMMSLALHDGRQVRYEVTWHSANNHTIELTPAIQRALNQLALKPAALTAIAVAQGPGSFTGLRIGMSVAKGMAIAHQIDLIAIPTLDSIAADIPWFEGELLAVLRAGRGRICAQSYTWQDQRWTPQGEAIITAWEQQIQAIEHPTLIAGEIDENGYRALDTTDRPIQLATGAHSLRRAGFLAEIAWQRIRAGQVDDPATVTPIYLHQPGVPHP
ncbi:MAG: tRNA (adenosine(37)-N6)-threonylcarbamoyltransferase complex dimerization subunit type 1 TsaB [Anaerolineae bacterium]|nr:tRNA (adenosine(37)-N6)-threonylcarbamoyltransferase complex dimerization subunit type 1 TsaB [Anaerolineae bacterium]